MKRKIDFIKALAVFGGTVLGVGIFGLPYIALQTGFFVLVLYFLFGVGVAITIHYFLGEVARDTQRIARIPGYAEEYLGQRAKKFSLIVSSAGLAGALLAYLILGSQFLYLFLSPFLGGSFLFYLLVFFVAGSFLIYRGIETIASFQLVIQAVLIFLLLFFFFKAFPFLNLENLFTFDVRSVVLPYGAVLFSLWGIALVPEVKEMVERDRKRLLAVIASGIIIVALCYIFFTFIVLGASGAGTSRDAISGFSKSIGNKIINLGFIFGLIATFTSFITLGLTLKKIFWYDLKLPQNISCLIACFAPLILFLFGLRDFIDVIGLTGAIFLGMEGIIVILIYRSFLKKRFQRQAGFHTYFLIFLLLAGMVTELIYFFLR